VLNFHRMVKTGRLNFMICLDIAEWITFNDFSSYLWVVCLAHLPFKAISQHSPGFNLQELVLTNLMNKLCDR